MGVCRGRVEVDTALVETSVLGRDVVIGEGGAASPNLQRSLAPASPQSHAQVQPRVSQRHAIPRVVAVKEGRDNG